MLQIKLQNIAVLNDLSVGLRGGTPYGGVAPNPLIYFFHISLVIAILKIVLISYLFLYWLKYFII